MSIPRVNRPLADGSSYILPQLEGEIFTIPGFKSVFRMFASQAQTDNGMAVFAWDGVKNDTAPFHHHNYAHDIFLVAEGTMLCWNGDQCRLLGPGDFASVPPGTIHKPYPQGPVTKAIDLITPGDWVNFFRHVSDKFEGLIFPEWDDRQQGMFPNLVGNWEEEFDVFAHPDHVGCEVSDWSEKDEILPDGEVPYFLKANKGPRWLLGGVMSRPFMTTKQSGGRSAISIIESSNAYKSSVFQEKLAFSSHHCLVMFDGELKVTIGDGSASSVRPGEVCFLPANVAFRLEFASKYVRFWSFASGNGIEALVGEAGQRFSGQALPDQEQPWDEGKLRQACETLKITIS
ncbi:hypothetical protein RBB50_006792 [Rhinocladiella similis]